MTLLGMTAILESTFIYLKAENAFGFLFLFHFIFSSVWAAPTKKSELPLNPTPHKKHCVIL
jgi:hypothetical protein